MIKSVLLAASLAASALVAVPPARAQVVIESGTPTSTSRSGTVTTPPSVDNGVANGVVKPSGSPSVGNGVANGVVKPAGSPSVDNGVANGSAKSSTVNQ